MLYFIVTYIFMPGDDSESPFRKDGTFRLDSSAKEFEDVRWSTDHPLREATKEGYTKVLNHKLTR